jgi:hypothetical protein
MYCLQNVREMSEYKKENSQLCRNLNPEAPEHKIRHDTAREMPTDTYYTGDFLGPRFGVDIVKSRKSPDAVIK